VEGLTAGQIQMDPRYVQFKQYKNSTLASVLHNARNAVKSQMDLQQGAGSFGMFAMRFVALCLKFIQHSSSPLSCSRLNFHQSWCIDKHASYISADDLDYIDRLSVAVSEIDIDDDFSYNTMMTGFKSSFHVTT
jgi:hypothetical protein